MYLYVASGYQGWLFVKGSYSKGVFIYGIFWIEKELWVIEETSNQKTYFETTNLSS